MSLSIIKAQYEKWLISETIYCDLIQYLCSNKDHLAAFHQQHVGAKEMLAKFSVVNLSVLVVSS